MKMIEHINQLLTELDEELKNLWEPQNYSIVAKLL